MKRMIGGLAVLALLALADTSQADPRKFRANLDGYQENPSISTGATGTFRAKLNEAGDTLEFELTYEDLEGGNPPLFAHIHLSRVGVNGGVMAFLCGGSTKPPCLMAPALVTGMIMAADVIGPTGQGVAAGDFDELIRAMREHSAYANVHTTTYTTGEIRGQIKP